MASVASPQSPGSPRDKLNHADASKLAKMTKKAVGDLVNAAMKVAKSQSGVIPVDDERYPEGVGRAVISEGVQAIRSAIAFLLRSIPTKVKSKRAPGAAGKTNVSFTVPRQYTELCRAWWTNVLNANEFQGQLHWRNKDGTFSASPETYDFSDLLRDSLLVTNGISSAMEQTLLFTIYYRLNARDPAGERVSFSGTQFVDLAPTLEAAVAASEAKKMAAKTAKGEDYEPPKTPYSVNSVAFKVIAVIAWSGLWIERNGDGKLRPPITDEQIKAAFDTRFQNLKARADQVKQVIERLRG